MHCSTVRHPRFLLQIEAHKWTIEHSKPFEEVIDTNSDCFFSFIPQTSKVWNALKPRNLLVQGLAVKIRWCLRREGGIKIRIKGEGVQKERARRVRTRGQGGKERQRKGLMALTLSQYYLLSLCPLALERATDIWVFPKILSLITKQFLEICPYSEGLIKYSIILIFN